MPSAYEGTDIISYLRTQIYHTACRISYRVSDISLKSTELYGMIVKKEVCKRDYIDLLDRQNWI